MWQKFVDAVAARFGGLRAREELFADTGPEESRVEAAPVRRTAWPPQANPTGAAIVDDASREPRRLLEDGDPRAALRAARRRVEAGRGERSDIEVAADALRSLGDETMARDLAALAQSPSGPLAVELAAGFLASGHSGLAYGIAEFGRAGSQGASPALDGVAAESLARLGRHDEALGLLEPYMGRWPDPALLRRQVLSSLMLQRESALEVAARDLRDAPELRWLGEALTRHRGSAPDTPARRRGLLVCYGGLLISEESLSESPPPAEIARVVERLAVALECAEALPDRVVSISRSGDCLARWVAHRLGVMTIPLTARIEGQSVLGVAVNAAEASLLRGHAGWHDGPSAIFQWSHPPGNPMARPPEILGGLGWVRALPFEGVDAEPAAERVPASTAFHAALAQVDEAGTRDSVPESWRPWLLSHRGLLGWLAGRPVDQSFLGDLPMSPDDDADRPDWVEETVAVESASVNAQHSEESPPENVVESRPDPDEDPDPGGTAEVMPTPGPVPIAPELIRAEAASMPDGERPTSDEATLGVQSKDQAEEGPDADPVPPQEAPSAELPEPLGEEVAALDGQAPSETSPPSGEIATDRKNGQTETLALDADSKPGLPETVDLPRVRPSEETEVEGAEGPEQGELPF